MIVKFIHLALRNFAGIRSQTLDYGDIVRLSGQNGAGKTSIGTAPVWVLYGTDLLGSKYNPTPTNYEYDVISAALILSVDGKQIKFERGIDGGDNVFLVNDVPTKAKEYEATVAGLFDKEVFLSLYYPAYFFAQHWTKQRAMVMRNVTPPANSEVFAEMSRTSPDQKAKDIPLNPQAAKLAELTKKHTLDDLQKIHGGTGGQKSKLEKAYQAALGYTKAKQEAFNNAVKPSPDFDPEKAAKESAELLEQIKAIENVTDTAGETNATYTALQSRIQSLQEQVSISASKWPALRDEPIEDTCKVCKQPLQEEAVKAVTDDKEKRKASYQEQHKALVAKRKEAEEALAKVQWIDVSEQMQKMRELEAKRDALEDAIHNHRIREQLAAEVEQAQADEAATLASLRESIFILDAIKAFRAKEAELQVAKVQSLFTNLSVRLFKYVKSTGEYEPDFSIQMDEKDYGILSRGEQIGAGLELSEVLYKQSDLIVPDFIDNIESYTGRIAVYGQIITGRVVQGQELQIETEEASHA